MRADRDDEIGLRHGAVGAARPVASQRPQRKRVGGRKSIGRVLQHRNRNARAFRELRHRIGGILAHHTAPDDENRALGAREQLHDLIELRAVARRQLLVTVRRRRDRLGRDVLQQDLASRLDMRRSLRLGQRDAKRLAHRLLHLVHVRYAVRPLGDRAHEGNLVHVLGCVALPHAAFLHAAHADHRHEAAVSGADRGDEIGDAGPLGRRHDRRASCRARVAVSHERGALLVAREDEADLRRVAQRVYHGEVLRAGNAEDVVDTFPHQSIDERPRAGRRIDHVVVLGVHRELLD